MRLLHGFINFSGQHSPPAKVDPSETEIVREAVVSSSTMDLMEQTTTSSTHRDCLELARVALRVISHLCRKGPCVRNFAVLSHKTYTYCLKAFKHFAASVRLEFYAFLEAATYLKFERHGEEQFKRITSKAVALFYEEQMDIRVELFSEHDRSELKAYQKIIKTISNLLEMQAASIDLLVLSPAGNELPIIGKLLSLLAQCNFVLSYPSVGENSEDGVPLDLLEATVHLAMLVREKMDQYPCTTGSLAELFHELVRFLTFKNLNASSPSVLLARRRIYFMLGCRFQDGLEEQ
jgi:hypothetical protein